MLEVHSKLRLLCVDDNDQVLDSLSSLISRTKDVEVVGKLRCADDLVETAIKLAVDVVLLDLQMPGTTSFSAMRALRTNSPRTNVVVLTGVFDPAVVEQSLDAGAFCFVTKDDSPAMILEAVRGAGAGRAVLSPTACRMYEVHAAHRASGSRGTEGDPPESRAK